METESGPGRGPGPGPDGGGGESAVGSNQDMGIYIYGVVPADATVDCDLAGVGDPPSPVDVIRCGRVAALVSEVRAPWSIGSPQDLTRHAQLLDRNASAISVLPMRFGMILPGTDDVVSELLSPNEDLLAQALGELADRAQYVVKGRYVEDAILREVLSENREAARLRERIRGSAPGRTGSAQIRLGEIVSHAIAAKRDHDTRALLARLEGRCEASVVREPRHERDAVHVAVLVRNSQLEWLRRAVGDLVQQWSGRVDLRLLGPMAAYDFVATTATAGA